MTEQWVVIAEFPAYEVSNLGRVRRGERVKTLRINKQGYTCAVLWRDSVSQTRLLGPLVAIAFIGPRPDGLVLCHNDGDATHNAATNLRWDTRSANEQDKRGHGTARVLDKHLDAKLNLALVQALRLRYKPGSHTDGASAMAREYGVSSQVMARAMNGTNWGPL